MYLKFVRPIFTEFKGWIKKNIEWLNYFDETVQYTFTWTMQYSQTGMAQDDAFMPQHSLSARPDVTRRIDGRCNEIYGPWL